MTKLRRFMLPPVVFALVTLGLLGGTVLGDRLVFELVDMMLFHSMTEELVRASMSSSRWLIFGIKFFILSGIFSVLWGLLTSLAWRKKADRIIGLKNTNEATYVYTDMAYSDDREIKKNGLSFMESLEEVSSVKVGELVGVLFVGSLQAIMLLFIAIGAFVLLMLAISFVAGVFVDLPPVAPSSLLFIGAFVTGAACMVIGYMPVRRIGEY